MEAWSQNLFPPGMICSGPMGGAHCSYRFSWLDDRLGTLLDFFPYQYLSPVANLQSSIFPFTDHDLGLRRCGASPLVLHLQQTILIAHHPVIANHSFGLQTNNIVDDLAAGVFAVVVDRRSGRLRKPLIVLLQILAF